jgi:hypothetical protein
VGPLGRGRGAGISGCFQVTGSGDRARRNRTDSRVVFPEPVSPRMTTVSCFSTASWIAFWPASPNKCERKVCKLQPCRATSFQKFRSARVHEPDQMGRSILSAVSLILSSLSRSLPLSVEPLEVPLTFVASTQASSLSRDLSFLRRFFELPLRP